MRLDFKGFELKSLDDSQGEGVFSGYASTWDKDLYDDVIVKGAFAGTLEKDYGGTGAGDVERRGGRARIARHGAS